MKLNPWKVKVVPSSLNHSTMKAPLSSYKVDFVCPSPWLLALHLESICFCLYNMKCAFFSVFTIDWNIRRIAWYRKLSHHLCVGISSILFNWVVKECFELQITSITSLIPLVRPATWITQHPYILVIAKCLNKLLIKWSENIWMLNCRWCAEIEMI